MKGFPWDDLRKILPGCQYITIAPNGVETADNFNRLSRVRDRYRHTDRQTNGDVIERERENQRDVPANSASSLQSHHISLTDDYCVYEIRVKSCHVIYRTSRGTSIEAGATAAVWLSLIPSVMSPSHPQRISANTRGALNNLHSVAVWKRSWRGVVKLCYFVTRVTMMLRFSNISTWRRLYSCILRSFAPPFIVVYRLLVCSAVHTRVMGKS